MTTAIIVGTLVLLGLAIVINGLLRLKDWLKTSPPLPPPLDFDEDEDKD